MVIAYNIALYLFYALICLASLFNKKAKLWRTGRNKLLSQLKTHFTPSDKVMWMHCSSLGEFEQGRPLLEEFQQTHPDYKILLTFFSPSGYEATKHYPHAHFVSYMPLDTYHNAKRFIDIVNPQIVFFIKYDYWYHHLHQLKKRKAQVYLVSAIFRPKQLFFKWYGTFSRRMLRCFTTLFIQNNESGELLSKININNYLILGDTRFDRVIKIASQSKQYPLVEQFIDTQPVLIAGSTWPSDEQAIAQALGELPQIKTIIVPHEIHEEHIAQIEKLFNAQKVIRYTQAEGKNLSDYTVLIVDTVGMLSSLYRYAQVAYVGGGFTPSGIHNTLEAAVYGVPVVFGSIYQKFAEAIELIDTKGALSINNADDLTKQLSKLFANNNYRTSCGNQCKQYVQQKAGATSAIMDTIFSSR